MADEIDQPSQLAQAYIERIQKCAPEVDFLALDEPLQGFVLVPDPDHDALFLILDRGIFEQRKEKFGHDIGVIAQNVLGRYPGAYDQSEWVEAHVPVTTRFAKFHISRPGYIMEITRKDDATSLQDLAAAIHDALDQATVSSGMLPRLEDGVRFYPYELGLLQSSTLERGYLIQFYTEKDQCVALVFVDVRRALMDNLLDQTGPPALINGFTDYYYPKTPPEESQHNRLVPVFSFDRKETIYGAVSRRDAREDAMEPAYPALTYMFRLPADISHPIDRLVGLRTIFEELIQKHATDALDEDFFVYSAYDLDNLTTDQLFALHKETKGMDKDARRSHVAARLSEMGLLDDEEEDEEDVDEE